MLNAVPLGMGSNPGKDRDVCKYRMPSQHGGTLNSRRAASPLVTLVNGEESASFERKREDGEKQGSERYYRFQRESRLSHQSIFLSRITVWSDKLELRSPATVASLWGVW
ncbi:hypothetical protein TNCV_2486771 [Trichonephila clavipes]|uniref:Uncharacterized protein n=1 Tax=Trichonephila clavipes TaxID=2585209 RepID=A0A8X6W031_TRICX|nr:hypothetical protein TNCV_2486771 [Trichonephila clavipes]